MSLPRIHTASLLIKAKHHDLQWFNGVCMVQKVVEIVGISEKGFSEAAQDAVSTCAMTVREIRWARVAELECKVEEDRIVEYRTLMRIYFEVEN